MADSFLQGFSVSGDTSGRLPLVIASPHAGRDYPAAFLAATPLTLGQLRRAEDPFVDALLDGITEVPVMRALFGRAWLDLNRAEDEIDPAMFEDNVAPFAARQTDRVTAGLGVLPRLAAQGLEIYRRRIASADGRERIVQVHRPYHARLGELLDRARARHGYAILLDCHSMPTPMGALPPQIVLGDRHGSSASARLVGFIETHCRAAGWRVGRNDPYAGGFTTEHHAAPANGTHAVQIEIDRSLYMDPARMLRHTGFSHVARMLTSLATAVVEAAPALGLGPVLREAAE